MTPPLPTPQQALQQWEPHPDGVAKLIGKIKPKSYPGALCAGKHPLFDSGRLEGETLEDYRQRAEYVRNHCARCPVVRCPARRVR